MKCTKVIVLTREKECDFVSELNNTPCFKERKKRRLCSGLSAKWQKVVRPKIISIILCGGYSITKQTNVAFKETLALKVL